MFSVHIHYFDYFGKAELCGTIFHSLDIVNDTVVVDSVKFLKLCWDEFGQYLD